MSKSNTIEEIKERRMLKTKGRTKETPIDEIKSDHDQILEDYPSENMKKE